MQCYATDINEHDIAYCNYISKPIFKEMLQKRLMNKMSMEKYINATENIKNRYCVDDFLDDGFPYFCPLEKISSDDRLGICNSEILNSLFI